MIEYPYIAPGRTIKFVSLNNPFMIEARKMADNFSGCSWWPTGSVVVKEGRVIGRATNPSAIVVPCPRWQKKCPTGTGYDLCNSVCGRIGYGHSEYAATEDANNNGYDINGADLYLFGHWWCCKKCWDKMIEFGINNVYLLENANKIFAPEARSALMDKLSKENRVFTIDEIRWKLG